MLALGSRDYRFLALGLMVLLGIACAEKKPDDPATKSKKETTGGSEGGDDGTPSSPGGDDSGDGGSGGTAFDLCKDGLEKASLSDFESFVTQLCKDGKIEWLRASDRVYTGGDAKIFKDDSKKGATQTSVLIFTSSLVDAKVEDYWSMMQLQLKKPKAYRDNYEYDTSASLDDVKVSGDQVSYRYAYDSGNGGGVDYTATTKFITLKSGEAYVSATNLDKSFESMKALKGLIIINKKSASKTEVFTVSDQTYSHLENQGDAAENEAIQAAKAEQARMYKNAKSANKAKNLLSD